MIGNFLIVSPTLVQAASLSISPASGTFNKGCPVSLTISLDTSGAQTDGTDVILLYDPTRLTATTTAQGSIYPDYPLNTIDSQSGKISISGLASATSSFSGSGTFATVNFMVADTAPTGTTQVKFDFDPSDKSKTTDSNIAEKGTLQDILSNATNGNYTIGTGACGSSDGSSGSSGSSGSRGTIGRGGTDSSGTGTIAPLPTKQPVYPNNKLVDTALTDSTTILAIVGGVLTVLGIIGLAVL